MTNAQRKRRNVTPCSILILRLEPLPTSRVLKRKGVAAKGGGQGSFMNFNSICHATLWRWTTNCNCGFILPRTRLWLELFQRPHGSHGKRRGGRRATGELLQFDMAAMRRITNLFANAGSTILTTNCNCGIYLFVISQVG